MIEDRAIIAQTLSAIRRDLGLVLQPELASSESRTKAAMMSDMLGHLVAWHQEQSGAAEQARYTGHFASAHRDAAEAPARLSALEVEVTPTRLEAFLRARVPGWSDAVVEHIDRAMAGYSKDTFLFRATRAGDDVLDAVVRRDLPFGPGENTVIDEFALLRALQGHGLPLAEPLWCEPDPRWLGQPFIVSRRMSGDNGTEAWAQDEATRLSVCGELAVILARLHTISPEVLGVAPDRDPAAHILDYVAEWEDRWRRHKIHESPTLEQGFAWLRANVPADLDRLSIIHSDVGFHNILTEAGRITALLDWEFSHLGDPAEDLGYCRQFVEPLMPWDAFLAAYRAAGGGAYSDAGARFYEVWRGVRNAVSCSVAWNGFLNDRYPALKMGYQGVPLYRRFVLDVADKLERMKA